jgi:hypothetical protein
MMETEIGYRGSKSATDLNNPTSQKPKSVAVKEQRVDGSLRLMHKRIRCILMGFKRNYQIRIPSNLTSTLRNNYSVLSILYESELTINP